MDSDEDLRAALSAGAAFALVRVSSIARERVGTRSQVVGYTCALVRSLADAWPDPVILKHFGAPLLEADRLYLVARSTTAATTGAGRCASLYWSRALSTTRSRRLSPGARR